MSTTVGKLHVELVSDPRQYEKDLERTATKAGDKAGKVAGDSMGKRMAATLKKHATLIATSAGAAMGVFVADSARAFADFEQGMNEVFTLLPSATDATMKEMGNSVKEFSNEFGVLPDEVIPALYNALSAGVPEKNVFQFLETANAAAKAGASTTDEAVALLSQSVNAWGLDIEEATRVSDAMFTTVRLGVTTFPAMAQHMNKVSSSAAVLGISVEEIGAATAALTKQGQPTEIALTNLAATMTLLQKGTPDLTKVLDHMGYATGQAAIDALGLQGTLEMVRTGADELGIAMPKLTGRVQAANAIFGLTGQNMETAQEILGEFEETTGATTEAFAKMDRGVHASANRIKARIQTLMIGVGESIAPVAPLLLAFGPTIGRALGGAFGAGFGFLITQIPKLMAPVLAKITAAIASTSMGSALMTNMASGLGSPRMLGKLNVLGGKWGKTLGIAMAAAMAVIIVKELQELQKVWASNDAKQVELAETRREIVEDDTMSIAEMQKGLADLKAARAEFEAGAGMGGGLAGFVGKVAIDLNLGNTGTEMDAAVKALEDEIEQRLELQRHSAVSATLPGGSIISPLGQTQDQYQQGQAAAEAAQGGYQDAWMRMDPTSVLPTANAEEVAEQMGFGDALFSKMREMVTNGMKSVGEAIPDAMAGARRLARHEAGLIGPSIREGIASGKDTVKQAMADLRWAITHPMSTVKHVAFVEGKLTGKALSKALQSKNPDVRRAAQQTKATLIEQWQEATGDAWDFGMNVSDNLAGGIKKRRRAARIEARQAKKAVKEELAGTPAAATTSGEKTAKGFAWGIMSFIQKVKDAAAAMAAEVEKPTKPGSPTETGPLSKDGGIEGWGRKLSEAFADGLTKGGAAMDAVGAMGLSATDPQAGMRRSALAGVAAGADTGSGRRGGDTNIKLTTHGLPIRARTPLEVSQQLRRAARLGVIEPTREARYAEGTT